MDSLLATADAVRVAVCSTSTCTPSTSTLLNDLLLPNSGDSTATTSKPGCSSKSVSLAKQKPTKPPATKSRAKKAAPQVDIHEDGNQLSPKERFVLATEIVNNTLKSLSDSIKASASGQVQKHASAKVLVKTSSRKALRRSDSLPQSPLQNRTFNRTSSSPTISPKESRPSTSASTVSTGHRATADCARIAFSSLRILQASKIPGINLPPLQLENGMSVLVGKLISLGLDDLAIKELRILKRRLEVENVQKKGISSRSGTVTMAQNLPELLDFGKAAYTGAKLGLVICTQLQVLRLMTSSRKPRHIEAALEVLTTSHPSSPTKLLLIAAKESKGSKQEEKIARQLQTLSEIMLSLSPSVSSADDTLALELRLSVTPEAAIQLQTLALHNRFLWWGIAGHKGDVSKDIFDPFLRCLSTFARRSQLDAITTYQTCSSVTRDVMTLLNDCSDSRPGTLNLILADIYKLLGSLSKEANIIEEAIDWTEKMQKVTDQKGVSEARKFSVVARLVSLKLQDSPIDPKAEGLLLTLLEGLDCPFKGDSSEIENLLLEVSHARRSTITILAQYSSPSGVLPTDNFSDGIRQMCESLVFLCPRLFLRYLGINPDVNSTTKDILRHEQRRQFVRQPALHAIDSALFLIRMQLGKGLLTWDLVDSKLQDCLLLLDRLDIDSSDDVPPNTPSQTPYYARISNLYYTQFLDMRRNLDIAKDGPQMRILRRSIDCLRSRPHQERKAAQIATKLERMAEFCKSTGRYDELFQALQCLRDELLRDGVLSTIAKCASCQPIRAAWGMDDGTSTLGRTIHSLLKVQLKYLTSPSHISSLGASWSDEEKAVVLEHQLDVLSNQPTDANSSRNLLKAFQDLLLLYDRDQYPIRRLRVLLRLMALNLDGGKDLVENIETELNAAKTRVLYVEGTRDMGLRDYLNHFHALTLTSVELQQGNSNVEALKRGLEMWSSIRGKSQDLAAFECQVEDVEGLVVHLNLIADYLQMKGLDTIRLTALQLIADIDELRTEFSSPDNVVLSFVSLGIQWLQLGYSGKAGLALDRARMYSQRNGVTAYATIHLNVSYSDYLLAIGSLDKAEDNLACAEVVYNQEKGNMSKSKSVSRQQQRTRLNLLISNAFSVYSVLALQRGAAHIALSYARQCVRLLRRSWSNIEGELRRSGSILESTDLISTDRTTEDVSQVSIVNVAIPVDDSNGQIYAGSGFWNLITPLFRSLTYLSGLYAHHGMFQETIYYAEQAHKLAKQVDSEVHLAMAAAYVGSIWLKSGDLEKGSQFLMEAKSAVSTISKSRDGAILSYHLGSLHGLLGEREAEIKSYDNAEETLNLITSVDYLDTLGNIEDSSCNLEEKMSQLTLTKRKTPAARKTAGRPKAGSAKTKAVTRVRPPVEVTSSITVECPQLVSLKAMVLRQKARTLLDTKKFSEALCVLHEAKSHSSTQVESIDQSIAMARHLLLQSMEQMNADPVYSVLQDSTISFPSVVGLSKSEKNGDRLSVPKASPPRKQGAKQPREPIRSKSPAPDSFFDKLRQAQDHLTEIQSTTLSIAPQSLIHKVSSLMNSVAIVLSATDQGRGKTLAHPGFASCSLETARNLVRQREYKAIRNDCETVSKYDDSCWPSRERHDPRRSSLGSTSDMSRFQKDYIDSIPSSWTVISISLSDSRHELSITKFQASSSPFVLRLPLGRHNSIDADEEVFGFEQGHAELKEIIDLANESAHDAQGRTGKEAKTAWWEQRESLDTRLRDLLENIEKVWLGGFTGIFSQHARRPELLARFQKSFQVILDKHLPSRQRNKKRNTSPRITLDSRILELFIGLGDASDEDCDLSEPLTDLLYFVIDVLQFHGELNAYAEIDFDSLVVETLDALRSYHEAVRNSGKRDEGRHTILILDKALHSFPWESLPCMDGHAVSRLPSLGCLRERIVELQKHIPDDATSGHYISRKSGTYILNPSGDLKHTQATFQKSLQSLNQWDGIVNRVPSETEIKTTLESKDLFLYFGHGSGAQYIRAKEIKRLDRCAVTFLMGCSSGALSETGEFEPFGPPINYMHAGSPALVATLWDVTDKDIDRFAKSTLEHWGLLEADVIGKGNVRKKAELTKEKVSLMEAVARGRDACTMRYLNAASVCVYGVPVYLE